jgi:hypothetical protein
MVTCPRCQQPVDETVRSTCPLCFTPIPQANQAGGPLMGASLDPPAPLTGPTVYGQETPPQTAYPSPGMQQSPGTMPNPLPSGPRPPLNPGARISLTGEVIESGMPSGSPPSYVSGGPAVPPRVPNTGLPSHAKAPVRRPQEAAPERARGGNIVGIVVAFVVILGGCIGGWYWWMHRTNPKDQALAVYKAFLSQDFKTAYTLSAFGPNGKKTYPDADSFAAAQQTAANNLISKIPGGQTLLDAVKAAAAKAAATAAVGEPTINGDTAEVPTSCDLTLMGRTVKVKGAAHMINEAGMWKLDLTSDNMQQLNKAASDLIGKFAL